MMWTSFDLFLNGVYEKTDRGLETYRDQPTYQAGMM